MGERGKSGAAMVPGVVYEFIAVPCGYRYTTPLGLRWGRPPTARIYSTTRLYRIVSEGLDRMLLYSPVDPLDFALSVLHLLEEGGDVAGEDCAPLRQYTVAYTCRPEVVRASGEFIEIRCLEGALMEGAPVPYTRLYGALVEALVVASKAGAGVMRGGEAASCLSCALWAARRAGRSRFVVVQELLYSAIRRLQGSSGVLESLQNPSRAGDGVSEEEGAREDRGWSQGTRRRV